MKQLFSILLLVLSHQVFAMGQNEVSQENPQNPEAPEQSQTVSSPKVSKTETVQDLRYGVALYHFFQQSYFNSLTELMVGEQLLDLPHHGESAELLRGGISLSWGLDQQAEKIFLRLLEQYRDGEERDTAWFYLAKLQYKRGGYQGAAQSLGRIVNLNEFRHSQESEFISANILLRQGELESAAEVAARMDSESAWLPYYYFNLGATQTALGDWSQGVTSFQQLQSLSIQTEEGKSLKDRSHTAAGYAYLAGQEFDLAITEFLQVRLNSPLVDKALLGYGWAAAQKDDYRLALSPWQQLRERSLVNTSVQETLLAIPFAYEQLHAYGNALLEYENSVTLLQQALTDIDQAITVFQSSDLAEILQLDNSLGEDWFQSDEVLPDNPQAPYLTHLIAQHRFQNNVKELRELYHLADYLGQAEQRLQVLTTVLDEREGIWQRKAEGSQIEALIQRQQQLALNAANLKKKIALAEQDQDGLRLLDETERDLWSRIQKDVELIKGLTSAGENLSEEQEQLRLYKGMLEWQASEQYPARIWSVQKQQGALEQELVKTGPVLVKVQQLVVRPEDFGFAGRITDLESRVAQQTITVAAQIDQSEQQLRLLAIQELRQQQERLYSYLGQTRLAIARLYDKGSEDASKKLQPDADSSDSQESQINQEQSDQTPSNKNEASDAALQETQ